VSLIKRQRSLTEAVLISFGSTKSFPKIQPTLDIIIYIDVSGKEIPA
jgi:hypothetical protein